jgi:hypothetical protein
MSVSVSRRKRGRRREEERGGERRREEERGGERRREEERGGERRREELGRVYSMYHALTTYIHTHVQQPIDSSLYSVIWVRAWERYCRS